MRKFLGAIINCILTLIVFQYGIHNNPDETFAIIVTSVIMFIVLQSIVYLPELKNILKHFKEES